MALQIKLALDGDLVIISPVGEISVSSIPDGLMLKTMRAVLKEDYTKIVLNLQETSKIDEDGTNELINLFELVKPFKALINLANLNPSVIQIANAARLRIACGHNFSQSLNSACNNLRSI